MNVTKISEHVFRDQYVRIEDKRKKDPSVDATIPMSFFCVYADTFHGRSFACVGMENL